MRLCAGGCDFAQRGGLLGDPPLLLGRLLRGPRLLCSAAFSCCWADCVAMPASMSETSWNFFAVFSSLSAARC
jgi:hypothetical protein